MKKLIVALFMLNLISCSASIGTPPSTTHTTYSAAPTRTYVSTPVAASTTVTKTTY
jgi:hypothetical protein